MVTEYHSRIAPENYITTKTRIWHPYRAIRTPPITRERVPEGQNTDTGRCFFIFQTLPHASGTEYGYPYIFIQFRFHPRFRRYISPFTVNGERGVSSGEYPFPYDDSGIVRCGDRFNFPGNFSWGVRIQNKVYIPHIPDKKNGKISLFFKVFYLKNLLVYSNRQRNCFFVYLSIQGIDRAVIRIRA